MGALKMTDGSNKKVKLLYLNDILVTLTDEMHPLSAQELCDELKKRGVKSERKAIYSDLQAIEEFGTKLKKTRTPKRGFYAEKKLFEAAELRMLMDAVQASPLISSVKTKQIIAKLGKTVSIHQAKQLISQVYVSNERKSENEEIYFSIDKISKAIEEQRKIRFYYYHKKIVNNIPVRDTGKEIIFSPYALIWNNDNYYLIGNHDKYDNIIHMRIDKMRQVIILSEQARPCSEVSEYKDHFDVADYSSKLFNMFGGNEDETVELRCKNNVLEAIIDKVGSNVPYRQSDDEHFSVTFKAKISDGLIAWLMGFGDKVVVTAPEHLKESVSERIKQAAKAYGVL